MFGRKVIGSPEAFSGYDVSTAMAGWICYSADEFVAAMEQAESGIAKPYHPELRALYEREYSFQAARKRLESILASAS
jgi:hypothetical protein